MALAIKIDNRLFQRRRENQRQKQKHNPVQTQSNSRNVTTSFTRRTETPSPSSTTVSSSNNGVQPMVLDVATKKLTPEERSRRIREHLCMYCGAQGHIAGNCPHAKKKTVADLGRAICRTGYKIKGVVGSHTDKGGQVER